MNKKSLTLPSLIGYEQEKYIPTEMRNVSLSVLGGVVAFEPEQSSQHGQSHKLTSGDRMFVSSGQFHKILNIRDSPAFYMYTYYNSTESEVADQAEKKPKMPVGTELTRVFNNFVTFFEAVIMGVTQSIVKLYDCE